MFVVFLTILIDFIGFSILIPVLPLFADRLGASSLQIGLIVSIYALAQLVFLPVWGWISDRYGRRPVLIVSLLGTAASFLLLAVARDIETVYVARVLSGFFAASIGTAQAVVTDLTPPEERAGGMGMLGAAFGAGMIVIPTRSLAGSSIAEEATRAGSYREIDDPFGSGERVGLLRSFQPDLALAHVWAADPAGNALVYPPFAENVYGLLAAKRGVILSAEKIVSTDFLRRHADHVHIPGEIVRAVCEAPYGSHPVGFYAAGIPELSSYANDYEWIALHRDAARDEAAYERFVQEWVLDVGSHEGYLARLGEARLEKLRATAEPDSWQPEIEAAAPRLDRELAPSPIETMIAHAGRHLAARIREEGFETVLAGVGQATLMSWLALHALRDEGIEIALMLETGVLGHDPRPADPFGFNYRNLPTARMLTDIFGILALHAGGAQNRCIGTLGAGQFDRRGNLNSTYAADGAFLTGSGGANDIASTAARWPWWPRCGRGASSRRVDYVTSPGTAVRSVTTNFGRFEKRDGELVLTGWVESAGPDRDSVLREIQSRCAFELRIADDLEVMGAPTPESWPCCGSSIPTGSSWAGSAPETPALSSARDPARYVLGVLCATYALNHMDRQVFGLLVEPIKGELDLSDTAMGFLGGMSFALFYAIAGLGIARMADRGSRKTIISVGIAVWCLATAATGLARSFVQLALARVATGVGEASNAPAAQSMISDYFPAERRATAWPSSTSARTSAACSPSRWGAGSPTSSTGA